LRAEEAAAGDGEEEAPLKPEMTKAQCYEERREHLRRRRRRRRRRTDTTSSVRSVARSFVRTGHSTERGEIERERGERSKTCADAAATSACCCYPIGA
jgi:hypothetical protein